MKYYANKGDSSYNLITTFKDCYQLQQAVRILNEETYGGFYYEHIGGVYPSRSFLCTVDAKWH